MFASNRSSPGEFAQTHLQTCSKVYDIRCLISNVILAPRPQLRNCNYNPFSSTAQAEIGPIFGLLRNPTQHQARRTQLCFCCLLLVFPSAASTVHVASFINIVGLGPGAMYDRVPAVQVKLSYRTGPFTKKLELGCG